MWFAKRGGSKVLEEVQLKGIRKTFGEVESILTGLGFVRWSWDYNKATFDMKFHDEKTGQDYYLRIMARAVEGQLENPKALVELENAAFARHIFPHGLDYSVEIPEAFREAVATVLKKVHQKLTA